MISRNTMVINYIKIRKDQASQVAFLILFSALGFYLMYIVMNSPIYQVFMYKHEIKPILNSSFQGLLFSDYHVRINIFKYLFTKFLFSLFGYNEITYRAFCVVVSFLIIVTAYKFSSKQFGRLEAILFVLLFSISYHNLQNIFWVKPGIFSGFASFLSFYFLLKGFEEGNVKNWVAFGIINYLNLVEITLGYFFLPVLLAVSAIIVILQIRENGSFSPSLKKIQYFLIAFFISVAVSILHYYLRGLNLFQIAMDIIFAPQGTLSTPLFNESYVPDNSSFYALFIKLMYGTFVTLNFDMVDKGIVGLPRAHWCYFILFLIGLLGCYIKNRKLFWCFLSVFLIPVVIFLMIFHMAVARYLSFILPFYIITVAVGFVFLFSFIVRFLSSKIMKDGVVLFSAFFIFVWLLPPKSFWSLKYLDETFDVKGLRAVSEFLTKNIKPSDIILNVTTNAELRGQTGDALVLFSYGYYLNKFKEKHRLSLLPLRKGNVGVWLVLTKPLEKTKLRPFYFPNNYSPSIVYQVNSMVLYYGKLEMPYQYNIESDNVFITPFWRFMKAYALHMDGFDPEADTYYKKTIESGYSLDRVYYNLGVLHSKYNLTNAISYLLEAIKIIESRTVLPDDVKESNFIHFDQNKGGFRGIQGSTSMNKVRYFVVEKKGIQQTKWVKEDIINSAPSIYSEYYTATGDLFYLMYLKSGDPEHFKKSKEYYQKGLDLLPSHRKKNNIKQIMEGDKNKTIGAIAILNLISIHEWFPSLYG